MDINTARQTIADMQSGKRRWDDNEKVRAQNVIDAADPVKQQQRATQASLDSARQIRDFNIQSNQPAIQAYEQSKNPLQDRYKGLLDQIKGNQQVAEQRQTLTTNNEMAKRGITNNSGVYQQQMTDALNPITRDYTNKYGETVANQNADVAAIDRAIAQLKTGSPAESIGAALNIGNAAQSANQFEQDLALRRAIAEMNNKAPQQEQYTTLGEGQTLFDLVGGRPLYTAPKSHKATGGGGSGW